MTKIYPIDTHAVTEMFYCLTNDGAMRWRNQYDACLANLQRKHKSGKFDAVKAVKLFQYMVDAYEREYAKEWGTRRLNKSEREAVAQKMVDEVLNENLLG